MPRVSVIIPAYNGEATLPETLRSVQAQTSSDWEVVVCDNASTDGTAAAAGGIDERIRVVRAERNEGPAGGRNVAIEASEGELLAFLDADDLLMPDYLTEQVAAYDRATSAGERVGVVACDGLLLGPGGYAEGTYRDRVPLPTPLTLVRLLVSNPIFIGALMPRAVFDEAGPFSTECFGTEDQDLWIQLLELGYSVVSNPRPLVVYRIDETSASADPVGMSRNAQVVHERALERGRLGRRERWVARRELRLQRLVVEAAQIQEARASRGRLPIGRVVRAVPRAAVVAVENPQRWGRAARRLLRGRGGLQKRLMPERDTALR